LETYKVDGNAGGNDSEGFTGIQLARMEIGRKAARGDKRGRDPELADVLLALVLLVKGDDLDVLATRRLRDSRQGAEHHEGPSMLGSIRQVLHLLILALGGVVLHVWQGHGEDRVDSLKGLLEALNILSCSSNRGKGQQGASRGRGAGT